MRPLVLVIEDEEDLVSMLEYNLAREGYETRRALTGHEGLVQATLEPRPDAILLDVMLPDRSGLEVCRALRSTASTQNIPVLMLTARGEEEDRVAGFEIGADDYVAKPFSLRELLLRVRALIRRRAPVADDCGSAELVHGQLRVDPAGHRVWLADEEVILTALEFRLLATLLSRRGRVQTRDGLLRDVWGIEADIATRTVDTHVKRLRKKLGKEGQAIETLRGVGYRFQDVGDSSPRD